MLYDRIDELVAPEFKETTQAVVETQLEVAETPIQQKSAPVQPNPDITPEVTSPPKHVQQVLKKAAGHVQTEEEDDEAEAPVQTTARKRNPGKRVRDDFMKLLQEESEKDRAANREMMSQSNDVIKSIADSIKALVQASVAPKAKKPKKAEKTVSDEIMSSASDTSDNEE